MPDGAALFETSGAWEDFSTPSRDLRLLNCDRCGSRFSRSGRGGRSATRCRSTRALRTSKIELRNVLASELASWEISYPRSDGSAWTLALKDVIYRATDRDEGSTCKRHASSAQRVKMTSTARGSTNDVGQERV
jgi:hypothetical protein